MEARFIIEGIAAGEILACDEPLSFWGGVDPATGVVIDAHHPLHGQSLAGRIVMMPGTRGSCTGSGVMLDLCLNGRAPAALVFCQPEDVVTLGALIAGEMFGLSVPVIRLDLAAFTALRGQGRAVVSPAAIEAAGLTLPLAPPAAQALALTAEDHRILAGEDGAAAALALRVICAMAASQGAARLIDVTRGHIDGCIYASPANLTFAEKMREMGAKIRIPTTMNAISVDRENWQAQGVPQLFGGPAAALADAYVAMGAKGTFTCAPYLLEDAPRFGECIAWAESNAVIYANTAIGARTAKHPDFLDLFIAMTGRAPESGVYLTKAREATRVIEVELPAQVDDAFWPLIGYLAGKAAPDCIPLLRGLEASGAGPEELKAICAAFGTTSAAPLLHIAGITPEADLLAEGHDVKQITRADLALGWQMLNEAPEAVQLVAIGSPHASAQECRAFLAALNGRAVAVPSIITAGRNVIDVLALDGCLAKLQALKVQVIPDLCWCSISEPVFPPEAKVLMTNSGKYAHYGPGLSGREVRFGGLKACAIAAQTGHAAKTLPDWLN